MSPPPLPPERIGGADRFRHHARLDCEWLIVYRFAFRRAPRRKAMAIGAVALGSAVATAMLGAMLDVGDRVNRELRNVGANLLVTPKSASLPVDIGGIRYEPVAKDEFIPVTSVPKIKSIFWQLNITAVAPSLRAQTKIEGRDLPVEGVWFRRDLRAPGRLRFRAAEILPAIKSS